MKWCSFGIGIVVPDEKCWILFHFLNLSFDVRRHVCPKVSVMNIGLFLGGHGVIPGILCIFLD